MIRIKSLLIDATRSLKSLYGIRSQLIPKLAGSLALIFDRTNIAFNCSLSSFSAFDFSASSTISLTI